jgi:hypothetical protein
MLSYSAFGRKKICFDTAVVRYYCILCIKSLKILAFVFGQCRWSPNLGVFWSFIAE